MPRKSATLPPPQGLIAQGGVASVDRALSLLECFDENSPMLSVTEIAARKNLHKSTVLRLLASLQHAGMVIRSQEKLWSLGPKVPSLYAAYSRGFSYETTIRPLMVSLMKRTNECVSFHIRRGNQRVCLLRVDCSQPLRDHIREGDRLPLNKGTGGCVLLAFSGKKGPRFDAIRANGGIALVGDRIPGLAGASAPVFNSAGQLVGALTLTAPEARFKKAFLNEVKKTAAQVSQLL
ncbi:MAG: IclR family transcriptional regulator [Burkholderiaceae bacterium]